MRRKAVSFRTSGVTGQTPGVVLLVTVFDIPSFIDMVPDNVKDRQRRPGFGGKAQGLLVFFGVFRPGGHQVLWFSGS